MYFYLNENCFFIKGSYNGAIYNLKDSALYSIGHKESEFLKESEYGSPIDDMDINFFNDLADANLGSFYQKQTFIEKIRPYSPFLLKMHVLPISPYIAYIKLNNTCSANCNCCSQIFCPTCLCTSNNSEKELPYEKWTEALTYLCDMGLKEVVFTGGDSLLYKDLKKLINFSIAQSLNVHLITNSIKNLDSSLPSDINIVVNCYENKTYDYENIINKLSSFKTVTIYCLDIDVYNKFISYKKDTINVIKTNLKNKILSESSLNKFDMNKFFSRGNIDSCLYGKIYFDYNGNLVPCYESINTVVGNMNLTPLNSIIKTLVSDYWYKPLTNDKCSNCEYYFACSSCKFLDVKTSCNYNENTGVWLDYIPN